MVPDIAQLERRARALLSPEVYDFYAGGSGQESTLRANAAAWQRLWLMPRVLRDVSSVDTSLSLWGAVLRTPVAVAPTAFHRLAHPAGEVATAAAAAQAGALFVLSTRCSCQIEDVGATVAESGGTWWFQVYVMRDRELTATLVRRAVAAGAGAVFLGRPVLWALACGGAPAVQDLLTGLTSGLAHAMALAGAATLAGVRGLAYPGDTP